MRGIWRALTAAFLLLPAGVVAMASASAATFSVTRYDDPAPDACAPSDCSVREAIIAANTTAGDDTIALAPGTYTLTIPDSTEAETATDATQGDLDVTDTLLLQSAGGPVTIDAGARFSVGTSSVSVTQPGTSARVLHVSFTTLTLDEVTITGGSGDEGAGILVDTGTLNVTDSVVSRNVANARCCGGGIGAVRSSVRLERVEIRENAVTQCCGGGIYNEASVVTFVEGTVDSNDAFGCCGAGIYSWSAPAPRDPDGFERWARLSLSDVTVTGNDVRGCCGGGIYNEQGGSLVVSIVNSTFSNNTASDDCCGGAIYSKPLVRVDATGTTLSGNTTAGCCGGAVYNEGLFSLTRGSITNNSVVNCCGGGVAGLGSGSLARLTNVTVSGNEAGTEPTDASLPSAGGLYLDSAGGELSLDHVTVARNSGSNGSSGISNGDIGTAASGTVRLRRSIVADNIGAPQCSGPITSQGYNLASDGSCGLTQPGDLPSTPAGLAPLSSGFHALVSGSAALDAIPLDQCPPHPATDQLGRQRPQDHPDAPGNGCDMGAIEMTAASATPTPTPTTPTPAPTPTPTTPTPTPTATPTPTPTTPTPSPGTTPTPTATSSASPSATPTPTATATASPTPTPEPIDPRCDDPGVTCGTDGSETITGTEDDDVIICGDGDDEVEALGGDDTIECGDPGDAGDKTVRAGTGDDEVTCEGTGDDDVKGGAGDDQVSCGAGDDVIDGGGGNDRLVSTKGSDLVRGGAGRDRLRGGGGGDRLFGGSRRDFLSAGRGPDILYGDGGRDTLLAGPGRDLCADDRPKERVRGCERDPEVVP